MIVRLDQLWLRQLMTSNLFICVAFVIKFCKPYEVTADNELSRNVFNLCSLSIESSVESDILTDLRAKYLRFGNNSSISDREASVKHLSVNPSHDCRRFSSALECVFFPSLIKERPSNIRQPLIIDKSDPSSKTV